MIQSVNHNESSILGLWVPFVDSPILKFYIVNKYTYISLRYSYQRTQLESIKGLHSGQTVHQDRTRKYI